MAEEQNDMEDHRYTHETIFDARARLQLLQLETRRRMAERLKKGQSADPDGPDEDEVDGESAEAVVIPEKWRLLPEGVMLHAWQSECLPRWLEAGRGTVKVATGGGKTLFALAAAQELQNTKEPDLRLVIVVPTIPLMVQWKSDLLKSNIPESAIGFMGGGQQPSLLATKRILVCVLNSARTKLADLVRKAGWPDRMLLVVDECHRAKADQAKKIFDSKARYTLGLSATPESADEDETVPPVEAYNSGAVGLALGPILYEFSLEQCHAAGLLSPFEVWHVGLELTPSEAAEHSRLSSEITDLRKGLQAQHARSRSNQPFIAWCQTQASRGGGAGGDAERFIGLANRRKRLLYRAKARAGAVLGVLRESLKADETRAIVFHEAIEEIEKLFLDALDEGVPAVLEHSKLPGSLRAENIEAFREGVARAIISAKSLVEGFNVPAADVGVIAASSGSVRQRIQSLGRMLRRKQTERIARIYVLFIKDTEDEAIYEKADWERVIGAEKNRYFLWPTNDPPLLWPAGLQETGEPPRTYRPPCAEVDVAALQPGDSYPGQTTGRQLHVDQNNNLRLEDSSIVPVDRAVIDLILATNRYRKATRTPCGHVITRKDGAPRGETDWCFVGVSDVISGPEPATTMRFKVISSAGRRQIARDSGHRSQSQAFARGTERAQSPESGAARDLLLAWLNDLEQRHGRHVTELCWDGAATYWIELDGKQNRYPEPLAPLEFRE